MDDYNAEALATPLSVGYPNIIVTDESSRLIKGCDRMGISFTDIKERLH